MRVLLHICCGPCAIYPLTLLEDEGMDVTGYFFNPNIHPYQEFKRRLVALEQFSSTSGLSLLIEKQYGLREFLQKIVYHEEERCSICYLLRLERTAALAKEKGFDAFSTTLLYSKYQRHNTISDICTAISSKYNINFLYRDFRKGWQLGIDKSIEFNLYRQPYCGCIYSEQERYDKSFRNKKNTSI
jgi:hypothetical protein